MSTQAYFVTGTDTGVGKTLVSLALLEAARARGWSTLGLKPVAAGGDAQTGEFMNEDARLLRDAATRSLAYADVNPVALEPAIAPHIAAAEAGISLSAEALAGHCRRQLAEQAPDFAVVEGAGGWLVPLNDQSTMADLAKSLALPVILVVGLKLGCLNHALLTAAAIESAGLRLAGWVGSNHEEPMACLEANIATLEAQLPGPRVGILPGLGASPSATAAAACLDMDALSP